ESCKPRLVVEAPAAVVTKDWERAYDRVQKQARLPGFRKGHVPRSLVKVHFADDVRREVAQHLIPDVYRQALSEVRLDPVGEPDLQDVRFEEGAPLTFTAVVEIKPDIALGDVKGVEVEHTAAPVTGSDVDATLDRMREQQAEFRDVERAATPGDLVIVDYTLTIDGEQPVQQSGYAFMVGDGSVMPEVDQAVAGMRTGEQRQVGFRMPDDYRKDALRGKGGPGAERVVRRGLWLEAVAEREGFAPTDEVVDAEVEKLAQASQRPAPAVRRMMEKSGDLEGLRQALRERMTLEFLVTHATIRS